MVLKQLNCYIPTVHYFLYGICYRTLQGDFNQTEKYIPLMYGTHNRIGCGQ